MHWYLFLKKTHMRIDEALERNSPDELLAPEVLAEAARLVKNHGDEWCVVTDLLGQHRLRVMLLPADQAAGDTALLQALYERLESFTDEDVPPEFRMLRHTDDPEEAAPLLLALRRRLATEVPADDLRAAMEAAAGAAASPLDSAAIAAVALERHDASGDAEELARCAEACRTALARNGPTRAVADLCSSAMEALVLHYQNRFADPGYLESAIRTGEAVRAAGRDEPGRLELVLAAAYRLRSATEGSADLETACTLAEEVLALGSDEHAVGARAQLAAALVALYTQHGGKRKLERAVRELRTALGDSSGPAEKVSMVNDLCAALWSLYTETGDASLLQEAYDELLGNAAVVREDDPIFLLYMANVGMIRTALAERNGNLEELDAGLGELRRALDRTPPGHLLRGTLESSYANALRMRAALDGGKDSLDDAVHQARNALAASVLPFPGRGAASLHLVGALLVRYERRGDLADLEEAIEAMNEAVAATPEDNPAYPRYLAMRATVFMARHTGRDDTSDRWAEPVDLNAAIEDLTRSVGLLPKGGYGRDLCLSNLSNALRLRFLTDRGRTEDIVGSVEAAKEAAKEGAGPNRLSGASLNLASALHLRYEDSYNPFVPAYGSETPQELLASAVEAATAAVEALPPDHPGQGRALMILAQIHQSGHRYESRRNDETTAHLRTALDAYRAAAAADTADPNVRAVSATTGALLAEKNELWSDASVLYGLALKELPLLTDFISLGWESREAHLKRFAGVGSHAAAAELEAGNGEEALLALEQGRSVLLAPAWGTSSEADRLPAREAERYRALLRASFVDGRLGVEAAAQPIPPMPETAPVTPGAEPDAEAEAASRRRRARDIRELIAGVRSGPDPLLRRFHLPPDLRVIRAGLDGGAVVTINVQERRCDALMLTAGGVETLRLPDLTETDVLRHTRSFLGAVAEPGPESAATADATVAWLWDAIAGPVLDHLGDGLRRVWWVPGGALSTLPLHAAGHHREPGRPRTVLDRVVSSYAATLRSLARDLERPGVPAVDRVLFVAPSGDVGDSGEGPWPSGAKVLPLVGPDATRADVMRELPRAGIVHFACHAHANPASPADSHLRLHDGPLRFAELAGLDLPGAGLAFLAACGTARPGDEIEDEAIHLCSAFQLSGFPHTIGTLWPVLDEAARTITADVYRGMRTAADGAPAYAVHRSVIAARDEYAFAGPLAWAAHIHIGP